MSNPTPRAATIKATQRRKYHADVVNAARENHIWINAFAVIHPSDDMLMSIGRQVLRMLDDAGCTHQSECGQLLNLPMPELVIRVNKS